MFRRRHLTAVVTALLLLFTMAGTAPASHDEDASDPPRITDFDITPRSVDVTEGPAEVVVRIGLTDDGGVESVDVSLHAIDDTSHRLMSNASLAAGEVTDGTWEATLEVPKHVEDGTWAASIQVTDRDQWERYDSERLRDAGYDPKMTVESEPDRTAPEIVDFDFSPKTVDVRDSHAYVTVRIHTRDELSGVEHLTVWMRSVEAPWSHRGSAHRQASLVSGTPNDGVWEAELLITQYSEDGTWVPTVRLQDNVWNSRNVTSEQMREAGYPVEMEVLSNPDYDHPVLHDFTVDPQEVDLSEAPVRVTFRLHLTDDVAGVNRVGPKIVLHGAEAREETGSHPVEGDRNDGIWEADYYFQEDAEPGIRTIEFTVRDDAGNDRVWTAADLDEAGFPSEIVVRESEPSPSPSPSSSDSPSPSPSPSDDPSPSESPTIAPSPDPTPTESPSSEPEPDYGPQAVVGLIDTGINPYHEVFRDDSPRAHVHPSTYLPGYPEDAQALNLTLDAPSYEAAVERDCEAVWQQVEPGQLYWIPGTKIVGAVSPNGEEFGHPTCDGALVLDGDGHGTMTASRAAADAWWGACADCLIASVQGLSDENVVWAADNASWIDVQSNSWGPFPLWEPTGTAEEETGIAGSPEFVDNVEAAASTHPTFFASGNGLMAFAGVVGHPTYMQPELTPSVITVGGHDSGYVNTWPDAPPHVVSDSCASWAAENETLDGAAEDVGSGTSAASPYVAGQSGLYALEARRLLGEHRTGVRDGVVAKGTVPAGVTSGPLADGTLDLTELRDLILKTATERPVAQDEDGPVCDAVDGRVIYSATPVPWQDVPDSYPEYHLIGYGAVDDPALERALAVLRGDADLPARPETDEFFATDGTVRDAVHEIYGTGP